MLNVTLAQGWFIFGIFLMLMEFVLPGFVVFFFGVGAVLTAALAWLVPSSTFTLELFAFLILSIVTLVVGRKLFRKTLVGKSVETGINADDDGLIGSRAEVIVALTPERDGRIAIHGSEWNAHSDTPHAVGTLVTIVARENITLIVQ
ncbi:MAG: NfeD family protein [Kiritimatiellia bacterium]